MCCMFYLAGQILALGKCSRTVLSGKGGAEALAVTWWVCSRQTEWVQGEVRHVTSFLLYPPATAEQGCCSAHISHSFTLLLFLCVTLTLDKTRPRRLVCFHIFMAC